MKVKSESEVAQSGPTLSDPRDCGLPGSFSHGIFQARVLGWVPLPSPSPTIYKIVNYEHLLSNTGNCVQYLVIAYNGKEI